MALDVTPPGSASSTLLCADHGALVERIGDLERHGVDHETRIRRVEEVIFEARGAWKLALVLGTLVGGGAGAIVTAVLELVLRGHGS